MKCLMGNLLVVYFFIICIFHLGHSIVARVIVSGLDRLFGTDVYNIKTRPNIYKIQLSIWLRFRDVHRKYFPQDVEEINRIEREIREIREEM